MCPVMGLHLTDVLMREFFVLEVDHDEAFEPVVVEDEIEVKVRRLRADPHLSGDKGKAVAHFEQELLELANDGGFYVRFTVWLRKVEELQDVGILDKGTDVWCFERC